MINIKDAAGLAKRAINCIVIAITNCYRTGGGKSLLFIYREIGLWTWYIGTLQTAYVTKIVSRKQPTDPLRKCLQGVRCTTPQTGRCVTFDELIFILLETSQIDRFLDKLKCSPWLLSLMYRTNSPLSQLFIITSLPEPNPVVVIATQNGCNTQMKIEKTWRHSIAS